MPCACGKSEAAVSCNPERYITVTTLQDHVDYKTLHQDALRELEAARSEAAEHRSMLREDAAKAREDASAGRAEAARMRNEAAYERERCQRLQEQLSDSLEQVDSLTQNNIKYQASSGPCLALRALMGTQASLTAHSSFNIECQLPNPLCKIISWSFLTCTPVPNDIWLWLCSGYQYKAAYRTGLPAQVLVNDMQQKLAALDAEAAAARDRARQMEAKASSLDSERALLATAEQRLTRMVNELSAEKHRLMAQSQVEQRVCVMHFAGQGRSPAWRFLRTDLNIQRYLVLFGDHILYESEHTVIVSASLHRLWLARRPSTPQKGLASTLRWRAWKGTWQACRGIARTRIATCALLLWIARRQLSVLRAGTFACHLCQYSSYYWLWQSRMWIRHSDLSQGQKTPQESAIPALRAVHVVAPGQSAQRRLWSTCAQGLRKHRRGLQAQRLSFRCFRRPCSRLRSALPRLRCRFAPHQ